MAGISISGLASSLDTESIISKLMTIERAPRARMELRQGQIKARETALRGILAKVEAVSDAATSLRSVGLWADVQSVQSSASDKVSAKRLSGTGPGGYQVEVTQLARAEQREAPYCYQCGNAMQRAGSCYVCASCGTTSGCS